MRQRALLFTVAVLCTVAATACRTKTPRPQPQTSLPPLEVPPPPPGLPPVPVPDIGHPRPLDTGDDRALLEEIARTARAEGSLRDAFFALDAATLDPEAQKALQRTADWLRNRPVVIRIEGHCDERGTEQYNLALGERRAEAAASYLVTLGIDRSRIETISFGEERPFAQGSHEAAWAQNRRAHIVLTALH